MSRRRAFRRIHYISSGVVPAEPATDRKANRSISMQRSISKAHRVGRFIRHTQGATLMEYALMTALGSVIVIIALLAFFRT
jgi:Flp pilus assembly protein TadG